MYFVCCSSAGICHFCITFKGYLIGHKINFCCLGTVLRCEMMTFRKKVWILLCLFSYREWLLKHVLIIFIQEHLIFLSYLEKQQKHSAKKACLTHGVLHFGIPLHMLAIIYSANNCQKALSVFQVPQKNRCGIKFQTMYC